jgi:hypothetical protein
MNGVDLLSPHQLTLSRLIGQGSRVGVGDAGAGRLDQVVAVAGAHVWTLLSGGASIEEAAAAGADGALVLASIVRRACGHGTGAHDDAPVDLAPKASESWYLPAVEVTEFFERTLDDPEVAVALSLVVVDLCAAGGHTSYAAFADLLDAHILTGDELV